MNPIPGLRDPDETIPPEVCTGATVNTPAITSKTTALLADPVPADGVSPATTTLPAGLLLGPTETKNSPFSLVYLLK